jgi:antitoxin (DNA-binding transcriptional repressor) of toxin-antitoxin stability system
MKTVSVAKLKAQFSLFLHDIEAGEEIIVSFGRKKEKVAVIVPYKTYIKRKKRTLGTLQDRGKLEMVDFEITDEELFRS